MKLNVIFMWFSCEICVNSLQNLPLSECEKRFGNSVFPDNISNTCVVRINSTNNYPSKLFDNGSLSCPMSSLAGSSGFSEHDMWTTCYCEKHLVPSPDQLSCIHGQFINQTCDPDQRILCNGFAGLVCTSANTCKCEANDSIWNNNSRICLSNEDCNERSYGSYFDQDANQCNLKLDGESSCEITNSQDVSGGLQMMPQCPLNSHCGSYYYSSGYGPICKCNVGFTSDSNKIKCLSVKLHGEICRPTSDTPCDHVNGLSCIDGQCQCQLGSKLESRLGECRLKTGASCYNDWNSRNSNKCGLNMNCENIPRDGASHTYGNRYESHNQCKCKPDFTNVDGSCYKKHGNVCQIDSECIHTMHCNDGICRCSNPLFQKIDSTGFVCIDLIGAPCKATTFGSNHLTFCRNGTVACVPDRAVSITSGGECLLNYNEICKPGGCNYEKGLSCIEGRCQCVDPSLMYRDDIGCVSTIGGRCGDVFKTGFCENFATNCDKFYTIQCIPPAKCSPSNKWISKCIIQNGTLPRLY